MLALTFKKGPATDRTACILLLKSIIGLSRRFAAKPAGAEKRSKKMDLTRKIRRSIEHLVNKSNVRNETVNKLIFRLREGKIRRIDAKLNEETIVVDFDTKFEELLASGK